MDRGVIIACDFSSRGELEEFLWMFGGRSLFLKVGMELFYSEGPDLVRKLKERGHSIFLDLKLHDIPNTVMRTMKVLSALRIDMCNVHGAGAVTMMRAAREGAGDSGIKLLAVTQLTSISEKQLRDELLIDGGMEDTVLKYGINAWEAGLDGVVCSTWEAEGIHRTCGQDFITVVPGIRLREDLTDDHSRVATPEEARKQGADYIVVGRSITKANDPVRAYERCLKEFL
ncbi:MAG: orotidine-5'-phosphate decarboxylase [Clostridiales bacterium]|nr:orotidine-5'-phosphate decarboxylase [Clostridiales bacterium]